MQLPIFHEGKDKRKTESVEARKGGSKNPYLLGKQPEHGEKILAYEGNGATAQTYENACDPVGGSYNMAAVYDISGHDDAIVVNKFSQDGLYFAGFYARRRTEKGWEWYCLDKEWHLTDADMPDKVLFQEGDSVEDLFEHAGEAIILVAQWENQQKQRMDCGHPMFSNQLMAHALSGMDGKTYLNTRKAYKHGRESGYHYFEVDLSYTTDERLVCCHGWSKRACKCDGLSWQPDFEDMTYDRIMNMQICEDPIMDARQFYKLIKKHPEDTFELDFHHVKDETEMKKRIESLLEDFRNDTFTLDRMLVQTYGKKMYKDIDSVYHFLYYQYIVGADMDQLDNIITFSLDQGICALAVRANLAKPKIVRKIRNAGLYILAYTVNEDLAVAQKLLDSGVNTICTDFITDKMLAENSERLGHFPFYVYYNSNSKEAKSNLIEEEEAYMIHTKSGNLEYQDPVKWENNGQRKLSKCMFEVPGKRFVGWRMRTKIDGRFLWYCTDHMYHNKKKDIDTTQKASLYIFSDEEVIPIWTLKEDSKLIMEAVWETEGPAQGDS